MKKKNIIEVKSFELAIEIVNLYKHLVSEKKEYVLSKQILRSGTSIGANIKESISGFSRADFRSKMSIAHKEASETEYWLTLLFETGFIDETYYKSLFQDAVEVNRIISRILISSQ